MQVSNLNLEAYFTERLNWQIAPDYEPGQEIAATLDCADLEWNVERSDITERRAAYRLTMKYASHPEKTPYTWEIAMIGYFSMNEDYPAEQIESFMDGGAPAVLYGAMRETLRAALSCGPFPVSVLPGVHFAGLSFQNRKEPEQDAKSSEPIMEKPKKTRKMKALS